MTEVWLKELQKVALLFSPERATTATLNIAATLHFSVKGVISAPLRKDINFFKWTGKAKDILTCLPHCSTVRENSKGQREAASCRLLTREKGFLLRTASFPTWDSWICVSFFFSCSSSCFFFFSFFSFFFAVFSFFLISNLVADIETKRMYERVS